MGRLQDCKYCYGTGTIWGAGPIKSFKCPMHEESGLNWLRNEDF